jgi:hypothetical protein
MAVPQGWFWATDPNGTSLPGGWRYGKDGKPSTSDPGGSAHPAGVWAQHNGTWDYREGGAAKPAPGGLAPQRVIPAGWKPPAAPAPATQAAVSSPAAAVQAITTPAPAKPAPSAPAPSAPAPTSAAAPTGNAGNWQAGFGAKGDLAPGATAVAKAGGGTLENSITSVTGGNATGTAGSSYLDQALSGVAPVPRTEAELAEARRAAFLGASDSMAGIRAVRSILADEVKRRGGTPTAEPQATVKGLEAQIASAQVAPGIRYGKGGQWETTNDKAGEQATLDAMSFEKHPVIAQTPVSGTPVSGSAVGDQAMVGFGIRDRVLAPSGNLPQATVNDYLSSDAFKGKLRASDQPLNEVAKWQLGTQPLAAPREDAGRDATLAAFAAQGVPRPAGAGEAVLAAMAGNAAGTRGGMFKPGNTVMLPELDPTKLKPLGIGGFVSSPSAWGYG